MATTPKAIPMFNGKKLAALLDKRKGCKTKEETVSVMNEIAQEIAMNARFISAVRFSEEPVLDPDGTVKISDGTKMTFMLLSNGTEKKFFPAFTSPDEMMKWQTVKAELPKTVNLGFDDYAALVLDRHGADGVVIDPFGGNLLLNAEIIRHWREKKQMITMGHYETVLEKGEKLKLTDPEPYPEKLAEALSGAAGDIPGIKAMWLRRMSNNGRESHLVAVDFEGNVNEVFSALGEAGKPHLGGLPLDMISVANSVGKDAAENVEPFYRR